MSHRTYFSTFIINTLKPCINREQSSCKALPPLSFPCSSACFSAACSGSSVGVMPGCAIQTLTCGGAGVITGARIARSRGQPLIGAAFAERGQVGKRALVTEKGRGVYVCAFCGGGRGDLSRGPAGSGNGIFQLPIMGFSSITMCARLGVGDKETRSLTRVAVRGPLMRRALCIFYVRSRRVTS